ncbi:metallophosphoesterase [candidate division KSB1 bacterium]|nr:metallophosphoesterase [candidate division KSB1 bacterium]
MFFFVAFSILSLGLTYVGWRLIEPAALPAPWPLLAWAAWFGFMLLPPLHLILRVVRRKRGANTLMSWLTYLSMGVLNYLFLLIALRDVSGLIIWGIQKTAPSVFAATPSTFTIEDAVQRRALVHDTNLAILGLTGVIVLHGVYAARRRPQAVEVKIPFEHLPEDLTSLRIVQISDLHVGPTIKRDFVERVVAQVQRLAPDIIAFTGDLADGSVHDLRHEVEPLLKLSARYGKFFVTGNHEYYSGAEAWITEARRLGFTVLMNEHRLIQHGRSRVLLAGVPDFNAGHIISPHHSDPLAATANAPAVDLKILLAHQPRSISAAAQAGFDLQLSGHTHGGQFFPWNLLVPLQQPFVAGLHRHQNTRLYVSCGTGYWGPPLRIGAPAEVTVIKLVRAQYEG